MNGVRFTAWLSQEERRELRERADACGCSGNYIVRMALRHVLFGTPVPTYMEKSAHVRQAS